MAEKYYLDTSIWMDYYEDRTDPSKDIGEFAFKLLCKLLASKSKIVVSTFLLRELETAYTLDQIRGLTLHFEKIMEKVDVSEEQWNEAKKIAEERKLPRGDAIHAILARDNKAVLVSRDKHFQLLKDICEVVKPEELI
ncbi:type II toxin-antitoxin system VapC family toxin [Candidatus Woesearchaeota archaeon]|nr:type II toxin-antitoxin system VapC family toxin [Candidatus Woesearchaeota archaeon]